jgi:hypothetical protein
VYAGPSANRHVMRRRAADITLTSDFNRPYTSGWAWCRVRTVLLVAAVLQTYYRIVLPAGASKTAAGTAPWRTGCIS